jgi:hypothetical protein
MCKSKILLTVKEFPKSACFHLFLAGIILTSIFTSTSLAVAQGNLMVIPKRVVFEGTKKSQEIILGNTGNDTAKYVVSIVQYRMKSDGTYEKITEPDPGQFFADKYLRFFPRTVTLLPKESQTIKMQLVKTDKLEPGEYRSHIYFTSVPNQKALGEKDILPKDTAALSVQLFPQFGITIPVIIRVGPSTAKVSLSDLSLEKVNDSVQKLSMIFTRSGNFSVYGDIMVNYISPQGQTIAVGMAKGFAVYTPNLTRQFQLTIKKIAGVDFNSGKLKVSYVPQSDVKSGKLAEAEIQLH